MCPVISTELHILIWIQEHLTHPALDHFFILITNLGDAGLIWIVFGLLLLLKKEYRHIGILVLLSLLGSLIVTNGILKNWIARPRPYSVYPIDLLIDKNPEFSFPSGHTSASFAAAWMLYMNKKRLGIYAMVLAILIGLSRLYLFMHYPTDVIAGAVVGILIAEGVYAIYDYWRLRRINKSSC